ncbi:MAG: recombinase RecJ [Halobacteriales archaeon]|nr:recombinase RecJ [Halobacteriales archaeon]
MDEALIDSESLSPERRSLLPGRGFFVPDTVRDEREAAEAAETLADASVVVLADPDADGLACAAMIREARGEAALLPTGPHELSTGLAYVAEHGEPGLELFVCDLCPDRISWLEEPLAAALEVADAVRWHDHHQWADEVYEHVESAGVDLTVGDSEAECTADVTLRELTDAGAALDERFAELAAVTRDHDLWLKEDDRSADLADYAHWVDPETYLEAVREHGVDLPEAAHEVLEERRVEKADRIERALRRADYHEIGPYTVGVTYGRCSQNEVAEAMRQDGADASVVVKPAASASIRGTDAFDRCHEVAGRVDGGGHPKAAGCKPDIHHDMLDYARHWTTQGQATKQVILQAFREVVAEGPEDE